MSNDTLSSWAYRDLSYMFSDRELVINLLETDEKNLAKHITVKKDGSVTLGKSRYSILNKLFNSESTISPEVICLRLIKIITGIGSTRNDDAYKDMCDRFTQYYKDGNYSLALSAIFVAYRFVLAPDIRAMRSEASTVERGSHHKSNVILNGVLVQDGKGDAVIVDLSNPRQVLFRRP